MDGDDMNRKDIDQLVDESLTRQSRGLRIDDVDLVDRLGQIEGTSWARRQAGSRDGQSVPAFVRAWQQFLAELNAEGMTLAEYNRDGITTFNPKDWGGPSSDGAIYGEGGYARYVVRSDGEVALLAWSTRPEKIALAKSLGVRVA